VRLADETVIVESPRTDVATGTVRHERLYELDDPAQDHRQIATYYNHEATKLRQISEEMSIRMARMAVYERLLGPTSDWVNGTRLLTQSYEDAAREHEQKAREHLELIHASRPPSVVRTQSR